MNGNSCKHYFYLLLSSNENNEWKYLQTIFSLANSLRDIPFSNSSCRFNENLSNRSHFCLNPGVCILRYFTSLLFTTDWEVFSPEIQRSHQIRRRPTDPGPRWRSRVARVEKEGYRVGTGAGPESERSAADRSGVGPGAGAARGAQRSRIGALLGRTSGKSEHPLTV